VSVRRRTQLRCRCEPGLSDAPPNFQTEDALANRIDGVDDLMPRDDGQDVLRRSPSITCIVNSRDSSQGQQGFIRKRLGATQRELTRDVRDTLC
jgi:hypothetical protein